MEGLRSCCTPRRRFNADTAGSYLTWSVRKMQKDVDNGTMQEIAWWSKVAENKSHLCAIGDCLVIARYYYI
jgi:hypothetical protein